MTLFTHLLEMETLTPPAVLTRLARAGITVLDVQKTGAAKVRFRVKSKDLRKVFAIFPRSCYTVNVIKPVGLSRAAEFVKKRAALCAAAAVFALLCALSDLFVLRVRFEGSGVHYADEALPLLAAEGVRAFAPYSEEDAARAERAVAALPSVSFCSVEKEGLVVTVTIEVNAEVPVQERERELCSQKDGIVESITVIRGRALVSEGDAVRQGQMLVSGTVIDGEGENAAVRETYPVAWCTVLCESVAEYESAEQNEAARSRALALALMGAEGEVTDTDITVTGTEGAYVYRVALTYRQIYSVGI